MGRYPVHQSRGGKEKRIDIGVLRPSKRGPPASRGERITRTVRKRKKKGRSCLSSERKGITHALTQNSSRGKHRRGRGKSTRFLGGGKKKKGLLINIWEKSKERIYCCPPGNRRGEKGLTRGEKGVAFKIWIDFLEVRALH